MELQIQREEEAKANEKWHSLFTSLIALEKQYDVVLGLKAKVKGGKSSFKPPSALYERYGFNPETLANPFTELPITEPETVAKPEPVATTDEKWTTKADPEQDGTLKV